MRDNQYNKRAGFDQRQLAAGGVRLAAGRDGLMADG
jgi:hypothetical protein